MRLTVLAALLIGAASGVSAKSNIGLKCLPSGSDVAINKALANGGKGTTVSLCPGSVHRLNSSIYFTAPSQTLTTQGAPTGRDRALLVVEGEELATAIFADCKSCDHATISNLIIDGNRPQLLRVPKGQALIEIGNGHDQKVTGCRLFEPRGWSALHVREGDSLNCRKAYVADNEIGPCGEEWDEEYDGLNEKEPPYGNPRADGISLACKDSVVERNTVFDATDGAIVLFGSAGSEVRENDIYSRTRVVLGGINLVDYDPWAGDYTGVKVHHNRLWANGRYFKVGIVAGPSSWSDDTDTAVRGATVTDNSFAGQYFGYAMVVSSADDFTFARNHVADDAVFSGVPGQTCPTAPENGAPTPFLINRGSATGSYQADFENGEVQHIICIEPEPVDGVPYRPWRMRDSPAAVAAKAAENPQFGAGLEGRLADALVGYQASLLRAIQDIEARMHNGTAGTSTRVASPLGQRAALGVEDGASTGAGVDATHAEAGSSSTSGSETDRAHALQERIRLLEANGDALSSVVDSLARDLAHMGKKVAEMADIQRPLLQDLYNRVRHMRKQEGEAVHGSPAGADSDSGTASATATHTGEGGASLTTLVLAAAGVLVLAVVLFRRYSRTPGKGIKTT